MNTNRLLMDHVFGYWSIVIIVVVARIDAVATTP